MWWPTAGTTYVAMHWRAHSEHMQDFAVYDEPGGVVAAVRARARGPGRGDARRPGSTGPGSCSTPGSGSPSAPPTTGSCSAAWTSSLALGFPVLVGASRKRFLGELLAEPDGRLRPVDEREHASTALTVLLAQRGLWGLRVHDVRASRDALRMLARMEATPSMTDELTHAGHRVLRPPRRVRLRATRRTDLRGRPHTGRSTPRRRRHRTTCATPSTTGVSWLR